MPLNNQPNKAVSANNVAGIPIVEAAPTSDFKGLACILQNPASDTTITLYIRHTKTGTWRSVNLT